MADAAVVGLGEELGVVLEGRVGVGGLQRDLAARLGVHVVEHEQARVVEVFLRELGDERVDREVSEDLVVRHGLPG